MGSCREDGRRGRLRGGGGGVGGMCAGRSPERGSRRVGDAGGGGRVGPAPERPDPGPFSKLFKTDRDWDYSTTGQATLGDRELFWPRGKMLGGSSSMNAQMWIRGHRADYDGWADGGCTGWGYDDVLPVLPAGRVLRGPSPTTPITITVAAVRSTCRTCATPTR